MGSILSCCVCPKFCQELDLDEGSGRPPESEICEAAAEDTTAAVPTAAAVETAELTVEAGEGHPVHDICDGEMPEGKEVMVPSALATPLAATVFKVPWGASPTSGSFLPAASFSQGWSETKAGSALCSFFHCLVFLHRVQSISFLLPNTQFLLAHLILSGWPETIYLCLFLSAALFIILWDFVEAFFGIFSSFFH
ncbi:arf-GAP with GTPase, ANK repeat and PH domain-containing protein 4 isoform X1 [Sapajus apella]|uniref:Arf-GAP with GTPase, ANK repeat and PH domain-containing protein 4 isoform X1 n=1 Tax=Sapajus apella TaxID=9515 RepID=A0A6J3HAD4_SAPAP|nr:arf-GAP with GTPase, ANK repeat and PH domain-containing protein 4 isoform X1 [Sapajus apella]